MSTGLAEKRAGAGSPRGKRVRWRAFAAAGCLAVGYLAATVSTHAVLSAGALGWSGVVPGKTIGLGGLTRAERAWIGPTPGYSEVLWAARPGGEIAFGFEVHNGGPVPVMVLGLALPVQHPDVVHVFAPAGAQLGPGFDQMRPFHPVALGPGGSVAVGLTERVICDPTIRRDARLPGDPARTSWLGDATSPVVLRYRVLGLTMSQTVAVAAPLLVAQPYRACK
jgi:hypothetical protein